MEQLLIVTFSELHVTMKKNEQAAEFTGDALVLQHAKVALPVSALGVTSAVFRIAAARLVLTSPAMPKLEVLQVMMIFTLLHIGLFMPISIFYFLIGLNCQS